MNASVVANPAHSASFPPPDEALHRRTPTLVWLDALKGIAILAVVLDHAFIVDDYLLWKHLYFAVSWFIFLAGISNTYTARRRSFELRRDGVAFWRHRLSGLLGPYLTVSLVAYVSVDHQSWSFGHYLQELLLFHTLPQLYFIALLMQYLAVFPLLYALLYRCGWIGKITVAVTIIPAATLASHLITFPFVLGAHYLFGASFLYLFVLGMVLEPFLTSDRVRPAICLAVGLPAFIWAEVKNINTNGVLMTHPPSNMLVVFAVALLALCYAGCRILDRHRVLTWIGYLGHRSLDIFLYHYFFILPILSFRHTTRLGPLELPWLQIAFMLVAVPGAIAGSLLAGRVSRWTQTGLRAGLQAALQRWVLRAARPAVG